MSNVHATIIYPLALIYIPVYERELAYFFLYLTRASFPFCYGYPGCFQHKAEILLVCKLNNKRQSAQMGCLSTGPYFVVRNNILRDAETAQNSCRCEDPHFSQIFQRGSIFWNILTSYLYSLNRYTMFFQI